MSISYARFGSQDGAEEEEEENERIRVRKVVRACSDTSTIMMRVHTTQCHVRRVPMLHMYPFQVAFSEFVEDTNTSRSKHSNSSWWKRKLRYKVRQYVPSQFNPLNLNHLGGSFNEFLTQAIFTGQTTTSSCSPSMWSEETPAGSYAQGSVGSERQCLVKCHKGTNT